MALDNTRALPRAAILRNDPESVPQLPRFATGTINEEAVA
jgi:hypothetical protein